MSPKIFNYRYIL